MQREGHPMGAAGRDILAADTTAARKDATPRDAAAPAGASIRSTPAIGEPEARRRAKRFAIVLMGASCVVTLVVVGCVWVLLLGVP